MTEYEKEYIDRHNNVADRKIILNGMLEDIANMNEALKSTPNLKFDRWLGRFYNHVWLLHKMENKEDDK